MDKRFGKNKARDLLGKKFGRLTIIRQTTRPPGYRNRDAFWLCQCDCGSEHSVAAKQLGINVFSCGCLQRERAAAAARINSVRHGQSRVGRVTKEYRAWIGLRRRCLTTTDAAYPNYGGRGITVCTKWRRSFAAFLADVGPAPSPKHSIDRIDNEKGYTPTNVRWATTTEQARNKRNLKPITYQGRTRLLTDWSRDIGIELATLHDRIYKRHWPLSRAMTVDPAQYHTRRLTTP